MSAASVYIFANAIYHHVARVSSHERQCSIDAIISMIGGFFSGAPRILRDYRRELTKLLALAIFGR